MWDKLKGAWTKFSAENGSMYAAALSFYGFTTVLPLLLLAAAILGYIVGSPQEASRIVNTFFSGLTPSSSSVLTGVLSGLVKTRGPITAISIVTLIWASSQIFAVMQQAFDDVWEVGKLPGFFRRVTKSIIMLIVVGLLFLLSIGSTSVISYFRSSTALSGWGAALSIIGSVIVALIFDIALFTLLYRYVPDRSVRWRSALLAGIIAGVVWEAAKQVFRVYLQYFGNYNYLYGSLGGIIILILWIYYSSIVLMLGAELAYVDEYGVTERHEEAERMGKAA